MTFQRGLNWLGALVVVCLLGSLGTMRATAAETTSTTKPVEYDLDPPGKPPAETAKVTRPAVKRGPKGRYDYTQNLHLIPKGEFHVGRDKFGPIVRVNLLKIKDWSKVPGVKKAWKVVNPEGSRAEGLHACMSEIKDLDGDGRLDIISTIAEKPFGLIVRYDYDGREIWRSEKLARVGGDETRLPTYDIDADGRFEVIAPQAAGVYCLDADTGKTKWQTDVYKSPSHLASYPLVVGHFQDKEKYGICVRAGRIVICLDHNGKQCWRHELFDKYHYGHEIYRYDADGDGYDEIFVNVRGKTVAFRGDGSILWQDNTQREHSDLLCCGDVDEDGRIELIYDHDGCHAERGPAFIVDALTGELERKIDYRAAGLRHAQHLSLGNFRPDLPGLEIAIVAKRGGIFMWDARGKLLWHNQAPASLICKGDWDGNGSDDIMVFALGANVDGIVSAWDGHGRRLYALSLLPCPTAPCPRGDYSHAMMCGHEGLREQIDLDGNGKADFFTAFGSWHYGSDQYLFLLEAPAQVNNSKTEGAKK